MKDPSKYQFGSVRWQRSMVEHIIKKLDRKEELNSYETAFLDVQREHVKRQRILKKVI